MRRKIKGKGKSSEFMKEIEKKMKNERKGGKSCRTMT